MFTIQNKHNSQIDRKYTPEMNAIQCLTSLIDELTQRHNDVLETVIIHLQKTGVQLPLIYEPYYEPKTGTIMHKKYFDYQFLSWLTEKIKIEKEKYMVMMEIIINKTEQLIPLTRDEEDALLRLFDQTISVKYASTENLLHCCIDLYEIASASQQHPALDRNRASSELEGLLADIFRYE